VYSSSFSVQPAIHRTHNKLTKSRISVSCAARNSNFLQLTVLTISHLTSTTSFLCSQQSTLPTADNLNIKKLDLDNKPLVSSLSAVSNSQIPQVTIQTTGDLSLTHHFFAATHNPARRLTTFTPSYFSPFYVNQQPAIPTSNNLNDKLFVSPPGVQLRINQIQVNLHFDSLFLTLATSSNHDTTYLSPLLSTPESNRKEALQPQQARFPRQDEFSTISR
jgi:hypothetical protein